MLGVAVVTTRITADCIQSRLPCTITFIVHESPGTIQGGWTEIGNVRRDNVACRIADSAVNAFDGLIGPRTSSVIRSNFRERIIFGFCWHKIADRLCPFIEKLSHID